MGKPRTKIWRVTCAENKNVVYDVLGVLAPLACPRCGGNAVTEQIEPTEQDQDNDN